MPYREKDFEAAIASWLTSEGGWSAGSPKLYDRARALIPSDLLAFVQETQPRTWLRYAAAVGGDAEAKFLDAFCARARRGVGPRPFALWPVDVWRDVPRRRVAAGDVAES